MDTLTGEKRKPTVISGLPADVSQISLRTWLSAEEVTALTMSVRCRLGVRRAGRRARGDRPAVPDHDRVRGERQDRQGQEARHVQSAGLLRDRPARPPGAL
ncbi:hypothetical protein ACFSTC_49665 [Nonomuraea ferruginea]